MSVEGRRIKGRQRNIPQRVKRGRPAVSERLWYSEFEFIKRRLAFENSDQVLLDFSMIAWFDLGPIAEIAKMLIQRKRAGLPRVQLRLPFDRIYVNSEEGNKPLNFLIDIGFVRVATECGARMAIGGRILEIELSNDEPSGLSFDSLKILGSYGYSFKEYRDKILLPITVVENEEAIENLRSKLWAFINSSLRHYQAVLDEGSFVDTFFREIAENAVEHSSVGPDRPLAIVTARLLRSIWDLPKEKQSATRERRSSQRSATLSAFLSENEDGGHVELIVMDIGPGITGTMRSGTEEAFQRALRPDSSRYHLEDRLKRGKSPLTGLGACGYCLRRLPALLIYREKRGSVAIRRDPTTSIEEAELQFAYIDDEDPSFLTGCNAQVILSFSEHARLGEKIVNRSAQKPLVRYFRVQAVASSRNIVLDGAIATGQKEDLAIIDVTDAPATKDIAWSTIKATARMRLELGLPVFVTGMTQSFISRVMEHFRLPQSMSELDEGLPLFVGISHLNRLFVLVPGTNDIDGIRILSYLISGSVGKNQQDKQRISDFGLEIDTRGNLNISGGGILNAWQHAISEWLVRTINRNHSELVLKEDPVRLPNGITVVGYYDLAGILKKEKLRSAMLASLEHVVHDLDPEVVVTYSAVSRQIASELFRSRFPRIKQVDFPDPYSPGTDVPGLRALAGRKVIVVADGIYTGSHILRILRSCSALGIEISAVVALVDSSGEKVASKIKPEFRSIMQINLEEVGNIKPLLQVDPYNLSLRDVYSRTDLGGPVRNDGQAFYNTMQNQKAFMTGHYVHRSGRHFSVAIDFYQLVKPNFLNQVLDSLCRFATGVSGIVTLEESITGTISREIAARLKIPHRNLTAVAVTTPSRHYEFAVTDIKVLEEIANSGGEVLLVEDAVSTGGVFNAAFRAIANVGIKKIKVAFLLNNTPSSLILPRVFESRMGEVDIEPFWIFRSFFPVYDSQFTCPHCRISGHIREAGRACPNSLVSGYLIRRSREMEATDVRSIVLEPARCARIAFQSLPPGPEVLGVPEIARCREGIEFAMAELAQSDSGLTGICNYFCTGRFAGYEEIAVRALSSRISTLQRLSLSETFFAALIDLVRSSTGEVAAVLLESAFVWPLEFLIEKIDIFLEVRSEGFWSSDGSIAILFGLTNRIQREATPGVGRAIVDKVAELERAEPENSTRVGVMHSLVGMFTLSGESVELVRWSWRLLASRLHYHRKQHHRILDEIPTIIQSDHKVVQHLVGVSSTSDALRYLALMLCLADIRRAIEVLIAFGELRSDQQLLEFTSSIDNVIEERGRLRVLLIENDWNVIEGRVIESFRVISSNLEKISDFVLAERDSPGLSSLRGLVGQRVILFHSGFLLPLREYFANNGIRASQTPRLDEPDNGQHIFAGPYMQDRLMDSLGQNIRDHSSKISRNAGQRELFTEIEMTCFVLKEQGKIRVEIANDCNDSDAENRFYRGSDFFNLNSEMKKYGGGYEARVEDGKFITVVEFEIM